MSNWDSQKSALILIDIQKGFEDEAYWGGNRNNPDAEANALKALAAYRQANLPIFHVNHSSQNPKSPLHASHPGYAPAPGFEPQDNEPLIIKNVNSAFIGTDLQERLDKIGIEWVVIAGFITNHCISTSARMAGNLGYNTIILEDACATFDFIGIKGERYDANTIHLTSLASLQNEFATIYNTNQFLELL